MGKLVADIIVETLQNAGVRHCYGVVGDTLNLIARSLEKKRNRVGVTWAPSKVLVLSR